MSSSSIPPVPSYYSNTWHKWNPPRKAGEPFGGRFQYTNVFTHQVEYEWYLEPEIIDRQLTRCKEECTPRFCPGNRECELVKDDDGEEACCRCGMRNPWQNRTAVGDGPEEAQPTDPECRLQLHPVGKWKWGRYPEAMLQKLKEYDVPKEVRKFCKKAFKNPADFQKDWTQYTKREFFRKHGDKLPGSVASFLKDFRCAPPEWEMYSIDDVWERAGKAEYQALPKEQKGKIRELRKRIKALDPKVWVKDLSLKARHIAAWEYGRHLSRSEVEKLLDCPPRPRSKLGKRKAAEAVE